MDRLSMDVTVNGDVQRIDGDMSLGSLVDSLGLDRAGIVAELNGSIPERERWDTVGLTAGDRIELVRFMGGG